MFEFLSSELNFAGILLAGIVLQVAFPYVLSRLLEPWGSVLEADILSNG